jgi:hypothetical protein
MLQYQFDYITFRTSMRAVNILIPLPFKIYTDDGYVKNWLITAQSRYFSNEATDDIIEYLKTLEINCSWVYPSIITHEETLIKFSARGIVSNTKIRVSIQNPI